VNTASPRLRKDQEEIVRKFSELARAAATLNTKSGDQFERADLVKLREIRVSSLNLLSRVASPNNIYYRELADAEFLDKIALQGILEAAMNDYRQGFVADNALLVSGEVFSDILVQAEVLLENDYKDAAAVIIRAVLENGLRRIAGALGVEYEKRETMGQLNEKLYKAKAYTAIEQKEITAKTEIGNRAAHGRFDEYKKTDVEDFLRYARRFLAEQLR
jgi:HEPN domain-containing protein